MQFGKANTRNLEFLLLVLCTQVKIYVCDVTLSVFTPGKLKSLLDRGRNRTRDLWTSKPMAVGSIPTEVKRTFQLARCGHTLNIVSLSNLRIALVLRTLAILIVFVFEKLNCIFKIALKIIAILFITYCIHAT